MKNILKILFAGIVFSGIQAFADGGICTMEYAPVCASVQVQCIKAPCEPVKETFGNKCQMSNNKLATYLYDGECKVDSNTGSTNTGSVGMPNPASVYCEKNGGKLEIKDTDKGQIGICKFESNSCEEWAFYKGECKKESTLNLTPIKTNSGSYLIKTSNNIVDINMSYPITENKTINLKLENYVRNYLPIFIKEAGYEVISSNWKYEIANSFEVKKVGNSIITVKFETYEFTGGAHGSTTIKTFNFNAKNGREIVINNPKFIEKISSEAIKYFNNLLTKKEINTNLDRIKEGLESKKENFDNWIISKYELNGKTYYKITFYFDQYQIASYSEGIKTFEIDTKNF